MFNSVRICLTHATMHKFSACFQTKCVGPNFSMAQNHFLVSILETYESGKVQKTGRNSYIVKKKDFPKLNTSDLSLIRINKKKLPEIEFCILVLSISPEIVHFSSSIMFVFCQHLDTE